MGKETKLIIIRGNSGSGKTVVSKNLQKKFGAEKVYHLHVRYKDDWNELYFRDYLMDHPEVAKEYENLKLKLWKKYEHNRDGYTEAKSEFILKYTKKAREQYGDKYL